MVIGYKCLWATRIGPQGDEKMYVTRLFFRCPSHQEVEDAVVTGRLSMAEYHARMAQAEAT